MTPDSLGVVIANAELCAWLMLVVVICLECHNISRIGCIQHVFRSSLCDCRAMCAFVLC